MSVWSEKIRYRSHPPDPRYGGAILETSYPESAPSAPSPESYDPREFLMRIAPGWTRKNIPGMDGQVSVPYEVEQAGAEEEYKKYVYERSLGIDAKDSEANLVSKLHRSRWYMFTQPLWDGKTYSEVKKEEPGYFLVRKPSGEYGLKFDIKLWKRKQWEVLGRQEFGGLKQFGQALTGSFLNVFDPSYWFAEDKAQFLYEKEYGITKQMDSEDVLGAWWKAAEPGMVIAISYGVGTGIGLGFGALKATAFGAKTLFHVGRHAVTTATLAEAGVGTYFASHAVKEALPIITSGDPRLMGAYLTSLGITAYSGYKGYRAGHTWGFGRTEAYLYGKHTYTPGSPEHIRFKEALKVSRTLEDVRSHKMQPLDISKDIMRMDPFTADVTIQYLKSHPRTTIGGSAASYTQIVGARSPRDIDIFVRDRWDILFGNDKEVLSAKQFIGKTKTSSGQHLVDIHGIEMYKPGKYHRFGFTSKDPVTIGDYQYFSAGEQLFRKGISSVSMETRYRHGLFEGFPSEGTMKAPKDIADFVTHARSLITSAKQSWWNRLKVPSAEKHLSLFLHPEKSPGFGQTTKWDTFITKHVKPAPSPKAVYQPGGYIDYFYPKTSYPSYFAGMGIGAYFAAEVKKDYTSPVEIDYKPVFPVYDRVKSIKPYKIPRVSKKIIATIPYKPVSYKPKKKNYPTIVSSTTAVDFDGFEFKSIEELIKKRRDLFSPSRWRIHPVEIDHRLLEVPLF